MDAIGLIPQFGGVVWTVLAFVVALSIIVAVHEYGHYIVGRWSGIHAEVFSLGFGPVLWSRVDRHNTRWQVAALPFGGYVKFLGDSGATSGKDGATMAEIYRRNPDDLRHTMHGAPLWARAATVAAGPVFNFVLSILVFTAIFMVRGVPSDPLTVGELRPLPAGHYELREGDEILGIAGTPSPGIGNGEAWSAYGLQPVWVAESPAAPFAGALAGPIADNLDWLIDTQAPDGAWSPAWDWSFVDAEAWARAKRAWQGLLTVKTLRALRAYGRLPRSG